MIVGIVIVIFYVTIKMLVYEIWVDWYLHIKYQLIGVKHGLYTSLFERRMPTNEELEEIVNEEESREPDFLKNHYNNKKM